MVRNLLECAAPGNNENVAQVANLRHIFGGDM
jgi:hypothetical protein